MKRILASAACAVLAACGGSGNGNGSTSNAALGTTFNYGSPQTASSAETTAVQAQLSTLIGVQGSPTASDAFNVADFSGLSGALLGGEASSFPIAVGAPESLARALVARAGARWDVLPRDTFTFENPGCASQPNSDSVSLQACVLDLSSTGVSGTATITGTLTADPSAGTASWSFSVAMNFSEQGMTASGTYSFSGQVAVTASTVKATLLADLNATATGTENGQSVTATIGAAESLVVDLAYESSPTSCVTGGTVEAKFVWTTLPSGATSTQFPNQAAKVTFTSTGGGCGVATIVTSP